MLTGVPYSKYSSSASFKELGRRVRRISPVLGRRRDDQREPRGVYLPSARSDIQGAFGKGVACGIPFALRKLREKAPDICSLSAGNTVAATKLHVSRKMRASWVTSPAWSITVMRCAV